MATYRHHLPQLDADLFLADGGIETTLIFEDGFDLPDFAAFPLLGDAGGRAALVRYFESYLRVARRDGVGIVLETPTWRASADWAARIGLSVEDLAAVNRDAVALLADLRRGWEAPTTPIASSAQAIEAVDAATAGHAAYFMVNCAHPTHFAHLLDGGPTWAERIRGMRANASTLSHAELDEAEELDPGDPADLADRYRALRDALPALTVLGGCCGTDHRHVDAISTACRTAASAP